MHTYQAVCRFKLVSRPESGTKLNAIPQMYPVVDGWHHHYQGTVALWPCYPAVPVASLPCGVHVADDRSLLLAAAPSLPHHLQSHCLMLVLDPVAAALDVTALWCLLSMSRQSSPSFPSHQEGPSPPQALPAMQCIARSGLSDKHLAVDTAEPSSGSRGTEAWT
jgi:hypothetical protein